MKEPESGCFDHQIGYHGGAVVKVPYSDETLRSRMREARLVELEWLKRNGR
ncbi:hypothetical protein [Eubacterium sp. 1001713B170207_170306_E7]|uniref:hypothetical protein n=1 Tax=Eubacterium sp. 1001713B170207_170306_E7 TaxID=2787097 RepID=UPI0018981C94|nr:hypothetical protein [Eubacterium sp. 1001713B170207_170306_E7]